jgi:hypothetical protein
VLLVHAHAEGAARSCIEEAYAQQTLRNTAGAVVGEMRPASGWLAGW